ncbi:MAG: GTPase Era [Anaerolineales bacterium]|nr:MAG: GTPase Era [Anaerolineales bacterium]
MENNSNRKIYKSGFVATLGKPNVGKSTLINSLLGQKIAAVSARPQTTRKRQLGILTTEEVQIIFVDTPGLHQARNKLGENMNKEANDVMQESDLILWIADVSQPPDSEDLMIVDLIKDLKQSIPMVIAMNKTDLVDVQEHELRAELFSTLLPQAQTILISAKTGYNLDQLIHTITRLLPAGEPFYPMGQITDLYEREISADLIREAALNLLRDEVPHGIAIRIDEFKERNEHGAYIEATVFVEKDSHKGIVIGQGGSMLKQIGSAARHEIEAMSGRSVYLRLRVKVRKNWRNDERVLRWFGY